MAGTIVHAFKWDTDQSQYFVSLSPGRDDVGLYESKHQGNGGYVTTNIANCTDLESIQCYTYSPLDDGKRKFREAEQRVRAAPGRRRQTNQPGIVCAGQSNGIVNIFNIRDTNLGFAKLKPRQSRACNAVSFSSSGHLATGLDKVRNDSCLYIWDIDQYNTRASNDGGGGGGARKSGLISPATVSSSVGQMAPLHSYLPNEVVSSVTFLPESPSVLLCGSYKFLREIDIRTNVTSFQCASKCSQGITVNALNECYFASYAEDGTFSIWDRRQMKAGVSTSEPALLMNKLFNDSNSSTGSGSSRKLNNNSSFRFSLDRSDEFTILHDGNMLRRWQTGVIPANSSANINSGAKISGFNIGIGSTSINNYHGGIQNTFSDSKHSYNSRHDTLFVASVLDSKTDYDKVTGFDYATDYNARHRVSFMCIRQSGQVFRMTVIESPDALKFDPYNDLVVAEPERVTILDRSHRSKGAVGNGNIANTDNTNNNNNANNNNTNVNDNSTNGANNTIVLTLPPIGSPKTRARRFSSKISGASGTVDSDESSEEDDNLPSEGLLPYNFVLEGDISTVMRRRAIHGYSTDCDNNVDMLNIYEASERYNNNLKFTWNWLSLARKSEKKRSVISPNSIDLAFEGVNGIWEGWKGLIRQNRYENTELSEKEFTNTIHKLLSDKKRIFTSPLVSGGSKELYRQLCLRVAGWNFELSQLNDKIKELEDQGKHEQAAGWAVFHGDVERAVITLAASRKERLRLMSTAVAGYLAYKNNNINSPWREQCRKLASELDNSYLRAIFAYIADGSWLDVLDEGSLPLNERLGIALRFLPEAELTAYLNRLTDRAVLHGDLEGIILTGLTPKVVDLLQSYVDKTCDIQTASLIASFGCPRFFTDRRVDNWIHEYHRLLNGWGLFKQRAKFDVARTQLSRKSNGVLSSPPVPRQIYLQCSSCKKIIKPIDKHSLSNRGSLNKSTNNAVSPSLVSMGDIGTKCENCNYPLPRCVVCLESLGSFTTGPKLISAPDPLSTLAAQFERWPTFCLSCNHGMHAGHAEEWFSKHDICPVPDCNCLCNSK